MSRLVATALRDSGVQVFYDDFAQEERNHMVFQRPVAAHEFK